MNDQRFLHLMRLTAAVCIFGAGFFCGSVTQRNADAQLGQMGEELLKRASEGGGLLGNAAKLGTTINELQTHVNGLQKNIDTLKAVRASLGGK